MLSDILTLICPVGSPCMHLEGKLGAMEGDREETATNSPTKHQGL